MIIMMMAVTHAGDEVITTKIEYDDDVRNDADLI